MAKTIAVLLSGCGNRDGAEINESVLSILSLRLNGLTPVFYSLDQPQKSVICHLDRETSTVETRNVLEESARIARGKISDIKTLNYGDHAALVIPGGMGVVSNFCDFALNGEKASVVPEIESVVTEFLKARKPILAICIAPALVGLVAHKMDKSLTLTLGESQNSAAKAMRNLGHMIEGVPAHSFVADVNNQVLSTPAFMLETTVDEIWAGIQGAVSRLKTWIETN